MPNPCSSCTMWTPTTDPNVGECRRYAPTPASAAVLPYPTAETRQRASWPLTFAVDGCGEHSPA